MGEASAGPKKAGGAAFQAALEAGGASKEEISEQFHVKGDKCVERGYKTFIGPLEEEEEALDFFQY